MSKFKKGDRVKRIDGKCFSYGYAVVTVDYVEDGRYVYFVESGTWLRPCSITHAYPNPPHKHAELIKAWADGANIQIDDGTGKWITWRSQVSSPGFNPAVGYRIKPSNPNADKIAEIETTISQLQQQVKELKNAS